MKCPVCGYPLEMHTSFEDENLRPRTGDYSVCVGCASLLEFDNKGGLGAVAKSELPVILNDRPDIVAIIDGAKWVIMQKSQN